MAYTKGVTALKQERVAHLDDVEAILNVCEAEGCRDPNPLEQRRIDSAMAAVDRIDKFELPQAQRIYDAKNRRIGGHGGDFRPSLAPLETIGDKEMTTIQGLPRHQPVKNFRGEIDGMRPEERAYKLGHFVLASIGRSCPRYSCRFEQSEQMCRDWGIWNVAQTTSQSNAGVFVPEQFGADLMTLRESFGVIRRVATVVPMDSDQRVDPKWVSGLTSYFVGESSAGTESDASWQNITLTAKKIMTLTRMSSELSMDAAVSYGDVLLAEIAYSQALLEDSVGFNGTGLSTQGSIIGIRTRLTDIDGAGTDSAGLNVQDSGNTWGGIDLNDFHDTVALCPQYSIARNPTWITSVQFYHGVMVPLLSATLGGVTIAELGTAERGGSFLGFPVIFSQSYPTATATDSVVASFGDHGLGIRMGDRMQTSVLFSEHASVGGQSVFERDQIAVRSTERIDIVCHSYGDGSDPGAVVGLRTGA